MRRLAAWFLIALSIAGCATPYQSDGFSGGFRETQLAPDVYRVSFHGNAYTSNDRVQDFALLRAADLTLHSGGRYFAVVASADQSSMHTHVTPGSATTTVSPYGNTATTRYSPSQVHNYYKPGVGMMVQIFKFKPDNIMTFDAEFLAASIRSKYGIR
jgi:hypothetical protein